MPTKDDVTARYAAAEADALAAKRAETVARREASKKTLKRLLDRPLAERFDAIAQNKLGLTTSDRRELVRSLEPTASERRAIVASTATRVEIWRSRLSYRVVPLAMAGLSIAAVFAFAVTAYRRTPMEWVVVRVGDPVRVDWTEADGSQFAATAAPGSKFILVRIEDGVAVIRYWKSGAGYVEGHMRADDLWAAK